MKHFTKAILLFLGTSCVAAAGPLDGTWVNTDPSTRSIPKVRITSAPKAGSQFEWWGKTLPNDTKYGPLKLHLLGDSTADPSPDKYGYAAQDSLFADQIFFITTSGPQLVLECLTIFKDKSGRPNYRERLAFQRQR